MKAKASVLITDRSELASNIYKLLLSPLSLTPIFCKRIEETKRRLAGRNDFELAIFNSNVFAKDLSFVSELTMKKIVICREDDVGLQAELEKIKDMTIILKPFHPDEFLSKLKNVLAMKN